MTTSQALVASLARLAAPASDQVEYLKSLGVADLADELALEFDDFYRPIARHLEQVSPGSAAACCELDRMLSSGQLGWAFADLESAEWQVIRATAAAAGLRDSAGGSP